MPRKSSIHFKPVTNVRFAVSHSERTDLSEPAYLLPKEHQLGNIVVAGSLSENDLSALFIKQKEGMTGQAKARASSPFWEGVVVLPNTNSQEQSTNLQAWKNAYEKETGHKVLHMSVHLDEGYLDALGKPQYNPHAHVIVSRMDEKNRVISLGRKQLANVQDLTAEQLKMERGSTLDEREGRRGRKHIPHKEFRQQADEKRLELGTAEASLVNLRTMSKQWSDADLAKVKVLEERLAEAQIQAAKQTSEINRLNEINEQYRLDREAFKASGEAKQADYQILKKAYQAALADLTSTNAKVTQMDAYSERLKADLVESNQKIAAALEAKAQAIENLVKEGEKSDALLKTANGYRDAAAKIQNIAADFKAENVALKAEIVEVKAKFETLAKTHQEEAAKAKEQASELRQGKAEYGGYGEAAKAAAAELVPTIQQTHEAVLVVSDPSLAERIKESLAGMVEWIKSFGGERESIPASSLCSGPVKHMDDLHCIQKTTRTGFVIHQLAHLDNIPALDDPNMTIQYKDGKGTVKGRLGKPGVQR